MPISGAWLPPLPPLLNIFHLISKPSFCSHQPRETALSKVSKSRPFPAPDSPGQSSLLRYTRASIQRPTPAFPNSFDQGKGFSVLTTHAHALTGICGHHYPTDQSMGPGAGKALGPQTSSCPSPGKLLCFSEHQSPTGSGCDGDSPYLPGILKGSIKPCV